MIRPVDLSNAITFTRASAATLVDRHGILRLAAIDEPRIDHHPLTGERLGLLVERQITNRLTHHVPQDPAWMALGGAVLSVAQGLTPAGTGPVAHVSGSLAGAGVRYVDLAAAKGQVSSASVFLRAGSAQNASVILRSVISDGTQDHPYEARATLRLADGQITDLVNLAEPVTGLAPAATVRVIGYRLGWFRVLIEGFETYPGTAALLRNEMEIGSGSDTGQSDRWIWGANLTASALASSPILTIGTALTRIKDAATRAAGPWLRWGQGTLYVRAALRDLDDGIFAAVTGDAPETDFLRLRKAGGRLRADTAVAGVVTLTDLGPAVVDADIRLVAAWDRTGLSATANGQPVVTLPTVLRPDLAGLGVGVNHDTSGISPNAHIRDCVYWPERLADAQLVSLTGG